MAVAEELGAAAHAGLAADGRGVGFDIGMSRSDARRAVRAAHATVEQPDVAALFGQGDISQTQATALGGAQVPDDVRHRLLERAVTQTSDQTVEMVAAAERAHVDGGEVFVRQREMRSACQRWDRDGMWNLHVRLDPEAGGRAHAVLDAHAEWLWRHDKQSGRTRDRTPIQPVADAFTSILDGASGVEAGRGPRVTLNVTVPHTWLVDRCDSAGVTTNGAALSPETLRRLACDAEVLPTVLGGPGEVLDVGRARRTATDAQRRALEARDRGCVNCGAPPSRCHLHHVHHWTTQHGRTDIDEMALTCRDCHILLHEAGHHLRRRSDGAWSLTPPSAPP